MSKKTELIAFRVDPALKSALGELAKRDERSLSQYITLILREHVREAQRKTEKSS